MGIAAVAALLALVCWLVPVTVLLRAAIVLVALTALVGLRFDQRLQSAGGTSPRVADDRFVFGSHRILGGGGAGRRFLHIVRRALYRSQHFRPAISHGLVSIGVPLFVVLCAPFFVWLWARLAAQRREPSNVLKFALGLLMGGYCAFDRYACGVQGRIGNGRPCVAGCDLPSAGRRRDFVSAPSAWPPARSSRPPVTSGFPRACGTCPCL